MMETSSTLKIFKIVVLDNSTHEIVGYLSEVARVLEVSKSPINSIEFKNFSDAYKFYKEKIIPNVLMGLNPLENLNAIVSVTVTTTVAETVVYVKGVSKDVTTKTKSKDT